MKALRTYIELSNEQEEALPERFASDDVRYPSSLVRFLLAEFTRLGDIVFDPFAGWGTTLRTAEAMGRRDIRLEYDEERCAFARTLLRDPDNLLCGDARQLAAYNLPSIDCSITSPPYMRRDDPTDPLTAYIAPGRGYDAYLGDIREIYRHIGALMREGAVAVVEVANLKGARGVTTLAWDIARAVGHVLRFQGEIVVGWTPTYGYGYDHSYCLLFTRPDQPNP